MSRLPPLNKAPLPAIGGSNQANNKEKSALKSRKQRRQNTLNQLLVPRNRSRNNSQDSTPASPSPSPSPLPVSSPSAYFNEGFDPESILPRRAVN